MADKPDNADSHATGPRPRRAGERIDGTMRRIGLFHAVVTAPVTAQLIDVNQTKRELEQTTAALDKARSLIVQLEAQRSHLELKLAQFEAAPIERVDGDPPVPLEVVPVNG